MNRVRNFLYVFYSTIALVGLSDPLSDRALQGAYPMLAAGLLLLLFYHFGYLDRDPKWSDIKQTIHKLCLLLSLSGIVFLNIGGIYYLTYHR